MEPHFELLSYLNTNLTSGITVHPSDIPIKVSSGAVCSVHVTANSRTQSMGCNVADSQMTVQVDISSTSYKTAWTYAREIETLVHKWEGPSTDKSWILEDGPYDTGADALDDDDTILYTVSLTFTCNYEVVV